jgi:plastocyanin
LVKEEKMKKTKAASLLVTFLAVVLLAPSIARAGDVKGKVTAQGMKSAENIAVYVDAIAGKKFDAPAQHVLVDQRSMKFLPHVVAVVQGTTVDFQNSDPVGHNVYWPSVSGNKKLSHNLGTWPKGDKKSFQFNDLGAAALLCNVHPEMSGYVVVVPTPYFAVTDKDGNFEIKGVPPGQYTLKTWSEDAKPTTQTVTVPNTTTTVDLTVKK